MIGGLTRSFVSKVRSIRAPSLSIPGIASRSLKYGYANARVRGMRSTLLKPAQLDELIKVKTIPAMVELLERTHYKNELISLSVKNKGSALVELASIKDFATIAKKLKKLAPKDDASIVAALLKRWDMLDLKTLLNARRAGKSFEEIKPYLLLVGDLSKDNFEKIAKADNDHILEEIKKTEIGKQMFSQNIQSLKKSFIELSKKSIANADTFFQLQTLLDAYACIFIDNSLSIKNKDVANVRMAFKKEIDARNIIIIERLKARGIKGKEIRNYLIPSGTFDESTIVALIASESLQDTIKIARAKFRGLPAIDDKSKLSDFEIALEKAIAVEKLKVFNR
ncbi:MAG: V-type ATPase subunit, partial [Candidatus Micrarchaeota archaeon]|nr:V-type ATPase subunit [Candidatus Micrarchaeota archaeon]